MWKPYTVHTLYFTTKEIFLVIFLTLFCDNLPILVNFHLSSNMAKINGSFDKSYPKYHKRYHFGQLLLKFSLNLAIFEFKWKLTKMGQSSINKVKEMTKKIFLSKDTKLKQYMFSTCFFNFVPKQTKMTHSTLKGF